MNTHNSRASCTSVQESIERYLDGALSPRETVVVDNHIAGCARCGGEMALARQVLGELHDLPTLPCPGAVTDRVAQQIGVSDAAGMRSRRSATAVVKRWFTARHFGVPHPVYAGAVAIVIVVSAIAINRQTPRNDGFTAAEIEQAEVAVKWTFAYVNQIGRRSGLVVRDEVFGAGVVRPMERAVRSAIDGEQQSPQKDNGGST